MHPTIYFNHSASSTPSAPHASLQPLKAPWLHPTIPSSYRLICENRQESRIQTLSNFRYWMLIALSIMFDCFIKTKKPEQRSREASRNPNVWFGILRAYCANDTLIFLTCLSLAEHKKEYFQKGVKGNKKNVIKPTFLSSLFETKRNLIWKFVSRARNFPEIIYTQCVACWHRHWSLKRV